MPNRRSLGLTDSTPDDRWIQSTEPRGGSLTDPSPRTTPLIHHLDSLHWSFIWISHTDSSLGSATLIHHLDLPPRTIDTLGSAFNSCSRRSNNQPRILYRWCLPYRLALVPRPALTMYLPPEALAVVHRLWGGAPVGFCAVPQAATLWWGSERRPRQSLDASSWNRGALMRHDWFGKKW